MMRPCAKVHGWLSAADPDERWRALSRHFARRIRACYPSLEFSGHRQWDAGEVLDRAEEATALVMAKGCDYRRFAAGRSDRAWLRQRLTDVRRCRAPEQFRSFWNVMKKTLADRRVFARRCHPVTGRPLGGWIGLRGFPDDRLCRSAVEDWLPRWRQRVPRSLQRRFHEL